MTDNIPKLSLAYLIREPGIKNGKPPLLVLSHGYGSNEHDLFGLAGEFPKEFLTLSVRAPVVLAEGHYAWFGLDHSSGVPIGKPEEAEAGRIALERFVREAIASFGADPSHVYLLGFSQGAMESLAVALTAFPLVRGAAALSGMLRREVIPAVDLSQDFSKLGVFIGHGTNDEVVPVKHAEEAKRFLESVGAKITYHEYPIAHAISHEEREDVLQWLNEGLKEDKQV